jgi:myo-inositol-1-phosphate synthase
MRPSKIRVAIVGVGNCASALVQGLSYYKDSSVNLPSPGLMTPVLGRYGINDIEISAAFDVSIDKVGCDLSEAIFARPNNTLKFSNVAKSGIVVQRGETLDGIGGFLKNEVRISPEDPVNIVDTLKVTGTQIVVSFLPVGSQRASEFYAIKAIEARCAYVNCIPVFLASNDNWRKRFEEHALPIVGDDIKSQVGATILHRTLAALFQDRGAVIDRTYQLNFGGNTDFLNMLDRDRLDSKKVSKTKSVLSQLPPSFECENIHVGPSDYVPWLRDRKIAHIHIDSTSFGGAPITIELKLEVWDSPNSAGVVVDAIRCARIAMDRKICGALIGPSSYYMKSPPQQFSDAEARRLTLRFIDDEDDSIK